MSSEGWNLISEQSTSTRDSHSCSRHDSSAPKNTRSDQMDIIPVDEIESRCIHVRIKIKISRKGAD